MINLLKKNFRYFFIPMFIYRKLSKSKFLRKYLTKINLLNQNAYIGVYKNVKDLTTDLLKKKIPQPIADNDNKQDLISLLSKKNLNLISAFENKSTWIERESFLCHALTLYSKNEISVLDIGGGFKPCYFTLTRSLTQNIKCHVIEFNNIVKSAKNIFSSINNLTYSSHYPENKNYDVVYFGSSIQYFEDLESIFEKIKKYKPNLIVFSYSSFATKNKTFTTGAYTFNRKYITPNTVYNIDEFIDFFSTQNYMLKHKSLMGKIDKKFIDSLDIETRIYNLVFENKENT